MGTRSDSENKAQNRGSNFNTCDMSHAAKGGITCDGEPHDL